MGRDHFRSRERLDSLPTASHRGPNNLSFSSSLTKGARLSYTDVELPPSTAPDLTAVPAVYCELAALPPAVLLGGWSLCPRRDP